MKLSFNKRAVRIVGAVFAGVIAASSAVMMAGCSTAHPTVKITVEFQSADYELDYKLYRKMYPATVQHFLELAENGYYDGLCVHNYTSGMIYTGVYEYNADDVGNGMGGLEYKDYYAVVSEYDSFTQTVFDTASQAGTYTLYGEFVNNGFSVENNGLSHKYGSLVMYYNDISTCTTKVRTQLSSSKDKTAVKDYKYNSATSEFYIFTGSTQTVNDAKYCVFGELVDEEQLDTLSNAITDYINAQDEDYSFTETYSKVWVDTKDAYADKHYVSYSVPKEPIVIKSVKIKNY